MPGLALPTLSLAVCAALLTGAPAWAKAPHGDEDPTPELNEEREGLIAKILRGEDVPASVRRFGELVSRRDAVVATSESARKRERDLREARAAYREAYRKTADYEMGWRCRFSASPNGPEASNSSDWLADWGRVVRKQTVRFAPKNALDEGTIGTMYEVDGVHAQHYIHGEIFGANVGPFSAEVGDLVLVCDGGWDAWKEHDRKLFPSRYPLYKGLPPPWDRVLQNGFALKIAEPPLFAQKGQWNPIHVTGNLFFWAIHDVKWKLPEDRYVLYDLEVARDLGQGRFEIDEGQGLSWILEVPEGLERRELLVPGRTAWVIMGQPRFDPVLKKLVLRAADVEGHYLRSP